VAWAVDVGEEEFEGAQALAEAADEELPFLRGEDLGEEVASPWLASPWVAADDVEGDAHFAQGGGHAVLEEAEFGGFEAAEVFEEGVVMRAGETVRREQFVPVVWAAWAVCGG